MENPQVRELEDRKQHAEHSKKRPCEAQSPREGEGDGRAAALCLLPFGREQSVFCIVNFIQPLGSFSGL